MITHTDIHEPVSIPVGNFTLHGEVEIPHNSLSLVLFSHGSGSSRLSPRNQFVAKTLRDAGIGTFLFDLLAPQEDSMRTRFNIHLLTDRLVYITGYIMEKEYAGGLNIGYFGASTGAASALNASAKLGAKIKAVVSRGGRPDLAMPLLENVHAATLLIVGSLDDEVLELNREAYEKLRQPKELVIIPGATHLFEEPGKLEEVSAQAASWFSRYLVDDVSHAISEK
jgi:putative phosphoribosyl transferase